MFVICFISQWIKRVYKSLLNTFSKTFLLIIRDNSAWNVSGKSSNMPTPLTPLLCVHWKVKCNTMPASLTRKTFKKNGCNHAINTTKLAQLMIYKKISSRSGTVTAKKCKIPICMAHLTKEILGHVLYYVTMFPLNLCFTDHYSTPKLVISR